ncbi:MAG: MBOAT family O-acyltransferase, partial [Bacteroidia bacterium]
MVFSSILFLLVFLPAFLLVFSLLPRIKTLRQIVILLFSLFFYAWGEPRFTLILLATTILDFFVVAMLDKQTVASKRKAYLVISLAINVGLLFYFKYFNFFVDTGNTLVSFMGLGGWNVDRILLPAGISFFIFESITYAVDVYRRAHPPLKNFWDY